MKFQIVLAAIFIAMISAKKSYRCKQPQKVQYADLNNKADVNANSCAINAGWCGDANALSCADGVNYNKVDQDMDNKRW
jgi:hypothetical protein